MRVTFYGVRGSYPSSGESFTSIGSHTTCVRIEAGGHTIIIDAGTGLARLGHELMEGHRRRRKLELSLFLTHGHHDHIAGLPHFRPAFSQRAVIHVFAPPFVGAERAVSLMFSAPWFPVVFNELSSQWMLHDLLESELVLFSQAKGQRQPKVIRRGKQPVRVTPENVVVRALRCYGHPRSGVYVYRVEHGGRAVVFATDVEAPVGSDRRLVEFAQGADLLVHDAQYSQRQYLEIPTQGFGHSTAEMAAEQAVAAGVKRLLLTHHSPENDDDAVQSQVDEARRIFKKTEAAREGMEIVLRPKTKA